MMELGTQSLSATSLYLSSANVNLLNLDLACHMVGKELGTSEAKSHVRCYYSLPPKYVESLGCQLS